jgi:hypothetical protein
MAKSQRPVVMDKLSSNENQRNYETKQSYWLKERERKKKSPHTHLQEVYIESKSNI